ncbi:hypothetical protein ACHAXT_001048 [Thalassiosira profunda]
MSSGSGGFAKPSDMRAKWESKIQAESRSEDIKAKEFMQRSGQTSQKRAQNVGGFGQKPSSVKGRWEAKIDYEKQAEDVKAKDFTDETEWSKKRGEVAGFGVKPSQARAGVESRVRYEKQGEDVKAKDFLKKEGKEVVVPFFRDGQKIVNNQDAVKKGIEKKVAHEKKTADEKARQHMDETTFLGVQRRAFKTGLIPLSVLFAKPHKDQCQISPGGEYLAWRTRGRSMGDPQEEDNGVMNLFVKNLETGVIRQITFYTEMDACVHYKFTPDDKSIVMLRETKRGSENYHLYAIEFGPFFDLDKETANDPKIPPPTMPRDLIKDKNMTCGIGFVGGVQLWTSSEATARQVYVSTSQIGKYSIFWDVSRIDIDTGKLTVVERNIMSTYWGAFKVWLLTLIAKILSCCCIKMKAPGVPVQWFPDNENEFRGRIEMDLLRLGTAFRAKARNARKWTTLHTCSFEDANVTLIGSTGGSGTARMEFNEDQVDVHLCAWGVKGGKKSDTTTYDRFDIKRGQYLKRIAGGKAKSDIVGFVSHPKTGLAQFVCYEWEKLVVEVVPKAESFDHKRLQDDLKYIRGFFPERMTFQIVSRAGADDAWVIYVENDFGHPMLKGSPSAYYLFTRSKRIERKGIDSSVEVGRNMELIFASRPEMRKYELARMDPITIKARDKQDLLCYMSRTPEAPVIRDGRQEYPDIPPPPMVVLVHGGPQARDSWGYNPLCQFLCSRGMRVLQVNYRGSTGFGARFLQRGMAGEFYKSVQTDILDALKYATSEETVEKSAQNRLYGESAVPPRPWGDPKQLAILGGSFGGYSALWGITANPELYKCSVAICPLSSVGAADEHSKKAFGGNKLIATYWKRVFGTEVSKLAISAKKASPMYQLEKVKEGSSIALYHGEDDRRAPIEHTYGMMEEMKKSGIAGEVVTFAGEGHGIAKDANRLYMYYHIEDILCRKLGLKTFDAEDDAKKMEKNTATVKLSSSGGKGKSDV